MKLLLDTCTFLWLIDAHEKLSATARAMLQNPKHTRYLSAASSFEIAAKIVAGKLRLGEPARALISQQMLRNDLLPLGIDHAHAQHTEILPLHHRDPFDRLLIAQAQLEGMTLLTPDPLIAAYKVDVAW